LLFSNPGLFCEKHDFVCVMFASIPKYKEFYMETVVNHQGLECIRLLNEIICDFDELLLLPAFQSVEKIKTIGSTYMVATGINPDFNDKSYKNCKRHVDVIAKFIFQMKNILKQINAEAFQNFGLRVGLAAGPVVAGVVGAGKPQFDIWGSTVNIASRMESHGEDDRIQVTENLTDHLMELGYSCQSRGEVHVKGLGPTQTYWLLGLMTEELMG